MHVHQITYEDSQTIIIIAYTNLPETSPRPFDATDVDNEFIRLLLSLVSLTTHNSLVSLETPLKVDLMVISLRALCRRNVCHIIQSGCVIHYQTTNPSKHRTFLMSLHQSQKDL